MIGSHAHTRKMNPLVSQFVFLLFSLLIGQIFGMAVPSVGGTCPPGSLMCLDGSQCYSAILRCDGNNDCEDTTDEFECDNHIPDSSNITCPEDSMLCKSGDECVAKYLRCDKTEDCADGSDEYNCPVVCEGEHLFSCNNGNCIGTELCCNNIDDCGDLSDETGCSPPVDMDCSEDEFVCPDGTCLASTRVCDGIINCHGGSDEKGPCPVQQSSVEITEQESMDNSTSAEVTTKPHCPDGSHEVHGCLPTMAECVNGFRCRTGHCLPAEWFCDDIADCSDGDDEENCNKSVTKSEAVTAKPTTPSRPRREVAVEHFWEQKLEIVKQERFQQQQLYKLKVEELETRNEAARVELKAAEVWRDAMLERMQQQREEHKLSMASLMGAARLDQPLSQSNNQTGATTTASVTSTVEVVG